jgi:hypothetical protein
MSQDKRTATYKILKANGPIIDSLLAAKERSEGYRCQIFFPLGSDSVYGVLDNSYVYRKKPDLDKLFVCLSAVQETWEGTIDGQQYDPFLSEFHEETGGTLHRDGQQDPQYHGIHQEGEEGGDRASCQGKRRVLA